jgi:hypothetical protein
MFHGGLERAVGMNNTPATVEVINALVKAARDAHNKASSLRKAENTLRRVGVEINSSKVDKAEESYYDAARRIEELAIKEGAVRGMNGWLQAPQDFEQI